jgi:hypothetical protein
LLGRFSESNRAVCIILDVDFQKTGRCSPVAGVYEKGKMAHSSSVLVRITAWYDWLLIVLALALGVYTSKSLDFCLSIGVQNALSIRAKEIGNMFATTGQIPVHHRSAELGLNDPFVAVHQSGGSVDSSSGKTESQMVLAVPDNVRRESNWLAGPTRVVRRTVHKSRFLMATASSTFGNKKYVVEVETSKQPIKAVFRESTRTMLIGLVFGLASATLGGLFLVKRALLPIQEIALAVQALPVIHSEEEGIKGVAVLQHIENLCVTLNEMVGQLEDSFQIGMGLPAEAFSPGVQPGRVHGELATLFAKECLPIGVTHTLLSLIKETERVNDISRNLATSSAADTGLRRTARLQFYFAGLVTSRAEHLCVLTKQLAVDLVLEARDRQHKHYSAQW